VKHIIRDVAVWSGGSFSAVWATRLFPSYWPKWRLEVPPKRRYAVYSVTCHKANVSPCNSHGETNSTLSVRIPGVRSKV
jgi:hypothetical protein